MRPYPNNLAKTGALEALPPAVNAAFLVYTDHLYTVLAFEKFTESASTDEIS